MCASGYRCRPGAGGRVRAIDVGAYVGGMLAFQAEERSRAMATDGPGYKLRALRVSGRGSAVVKCKPILAQQRKQNHVVKYIVHNEMDASPV